MTNNKTMPKSTTDKPFKKIPVTLLTGFLGAGKTTLLNRILKEEHGEKIAVIVNEFGQVGIDGDLIVARDESMIELNNGCLCCTVRVDLIDTLTKLAKAKLGLEGEKKDFDRVVIETTGLADPLPLIQTFLLNEVVATCYELDAIVTVVDGKHIEKQLGYLPLAAEQIALADILILNKCDLLSQEERETVKKKILGLNQEAKVLEAVQSDVSLSELFGKQSFQRLPEDFLTEHDEHEHEDHLNSINSVVVRASSPIKIDVLYQWLGEVIEKSGPDLLRYKGIVYTDEWENKRGVLQGVHTLYTVQPDRDWKDAETRETKLVFIGRNLDEAWIKESFQSLSAAVE